MNGNRKMPLESMMPVQGTSRQTRPSTVPHQGDPRNAVGSHSQTSGHFKDETVSTEQQEKKKKRKKKVGTKEERKLKRESEKLKTIYAPKDSHIQMITPEILQRLRGEPTTKPKVCAPFLSAQDSQKLFPSIAPRNSQNSQPTGGVQNERKLFESEKSTEFPSLGASIASTSRKSYAKSTIPIQSSKLVGAKNPNDYESGWETDAGDDNVPKHEYTSKSLRENSFNQLEPERVLELPLVSKRKPSKKPMIVSLNALIESKKESPRPVKTIEKRKRNEDGKFTIGNTLDSSGPVVMNRGKIREIPKIKRKTPLKKAIMKTRALRKANITTKFTSNINTTDEKCISVPENELSATTCSLDIPGENAEKPTEQIKQTCLPLPSPALESIVNENVHDQRCLTRSDISGDTMSIAVINREADIFSDKIKDIIKIAEESVKSSDIEVSKDLQNKVKSEMHSKKFRPYCDMYTSKDFHGKVWELLKELHRYQDRLYHSDPVKYKIKKRYIHGLKDVNANLKINKVVLVIIAPDIEPNNEKGGLDEKLETIMALAHEKGVPYVFSGNRYILGKPIRIKTPVSVIGILDYQAAEVLFKKIIEEAYRLREEYEADFSERLQKLWLQHKIKIE